MSDWWEFGAEAQDANDSSVPPPEVVAAGPDAEADWRDGFAWSELRELGP